MFNEREALRLRLEQLKDAEINVMRELRNERNEIYAKLRELDNQNDSSITNKKSLIELVSDTAKTFESKKSKEALASSYDSPPSTNKKAKTWLKSL